MDQFIGQKIKLKITSEIGDKIYESETIYVSDYLPHTVKIEYWNGENTDIDYSTGIKNIIRTEALVEALMDGSFESEKTDDKMRLIDSRIYEGNKFYFSSMTSKLARKIVIALAHDHLFIN